MEKSLCVLFTILIYASCNSYKATKTELEEKWVYKLQRSFISWTITF